MSWQDAAEKLWGGDWIAPMSEVLGINRRTIERWRAEEGAPSQQLQDDIAALARRGGTDARHIGTTLRRMAGGETVQDIIDDMNATKRALHKIEAEHDRIVLMRRGKPW